MNLLLALLLSLQDPAPSKPKDPPQAEQEPEKKDKDKDKEVVIIGQRRESDILDVPSGVTVVTSEQIRASGATNVVEVIQKQPGFFSSGPGKSAAGQTMDLRGYNNGAGNGQRTLVLVDGRKTNAVSSSTTDFATIPIDNIERVEIVRGPAAALYGDTALAGVVNIITKKGDKKTTGMVTLAGGNWDTFHGAASVSGPAEGGFYDAYVSGDSTQGYRDHSNYQGGDVTFRFDLPLTTSLNGNIKVGHHGDTRQFPGSISQAEIDQFGRRASVPTGFPSDFRGVVDYLDLGIDQSTQDYGTFSAFFDYTWTNSTSRTTGFNLDDRSGVAILQPKHVGTWKLFGRDVTFTTGIDLSYEDAHAASSFPPFQVDTDRTSYRRRLFGAFENIEVRPVDMLTLSGGARYDRALLNLETDGASTGFTPDSHTNRALDQVSPMAGATVRVIEQLSIYASYGRPFKYPTRDELIGFTATAPLLLPERSTSYEAGLRGYVPKYGSGSVTFYRMKVDDEIYLDKSLSPPFGSNVNIDQVTHQGIESEIRATPVDFFELFATHTFTRAEITQAANPAIVGNKYPVTPRLQGTVGGTVHYERMSFTLLGRYVGERLLVGDFFNAAEPLPSYWVMDVRAAYTYNSFTGFASVYNVADRMFMDNAGLTSAGTVRYNPAPGRSYLIGGEFRF